MKAKAAVVVGKGKVEVREVEVPKPGKGQALLKVEIAGVCGTDVHFVYDDLPIPALGKMPYPFGIGHEFVAKIVDVGEDFPQVDEFGEPLRVGDRIVFFPREVSCGECFYCRMLLQPQLCLRRKIEDLGGAFAEYILTPPGAAIFKVPEGLSLDIAVLTEPFSGAMKAVERALQSGTAYGTQNMGFGATVVVQGSGPVGLLCMVLCRLMGVAKVIVTGAPEGRLELCKQFGADEVIDINRVGEEERIEKIRALTPHGIGPDVVIEAAGVPAAFWEALNMVRRGGTVVEIGHWTERGTVEIDPMVICQKDLQIFGMVGYNPYQFGKSLRTLQAYGEKLKLERIITHRFRLEEVAEALETARRQECMKAVITFD